MTDRMVEIAEHPARIHLKLEAIQIEMEGQDTIRTPLEDLGVLVIAHPHVQVSASALQAMALHGISVLVCDDKRQPAGMMLPLQGHFLQVERMARQANIPLPLKKRLWQQVIKAKILAQSALLKRLQNGDGGLHTLAAKVRSGDAGNLEAQAARHYWKRLFPEGDFTRDREAQDQNRFLNYGYAILRAQVARCLCACGLHPSLGLQHHNRYSTFPLADDMMEPYRPFVDAIAFHLAESHGPEAEMSRDVRAALLNVLHQRTRLNHEQLRLAHAVQVSCQSLAAAFEGKTKKLVFPLP